MSYAKIVALSAKLQISYPSFIEKNLFIQMLKSKGPRANPCGIPTELCFDELYVEPMLIICIRFAR